MPGFGKAARRPSGDVGCSPAGPSDGHGEWPGIGQRGRDAGATPAAVCGPENGMRCNVRRCRKHRCTGSGMGRHPSQAHPTHDAHTAHTIATEVYYKRFKIKASQGGTGRARTRGILEEFLRGSWCIKAPFSARMSVSHCRRLRYRILKLHAHRQAVGNPARLA